MDCMINQRMHDKSKNAEREKVHKLTGNVLKSFDVFLLCFVLSCLLVCKQNQPFCYWGT